MKIEILKILIFFKPFLRKMLASLSEVEEEEKSMVVVKRDDFTVVAAVVLVVVIVEVLLSLTLAMSFSGFLFLLPSI